MIQMTVFCSYQQACFYYFKEEDLKKIVVAMSKRFPGGELYFDAESKFALNLSNATVKIW